MFIKYNDNTEIEINNFDFVEYPSIVRVYSNTTLNNLSGFSIYSNIETKMYDFSSFKYIYDTDEGYTEYTKENITYYTYAVYNSDNYITGIITTTEDSLNNALLVMKGMGKKYRYPYDETVYIDNNGLYNYKVVNEDIVEVTNEEKEILLLEKHKIELDAAKKQKINTLTNICETTIMNGIDYKDKHFSYNYSDQNNISNLVNMAKTTGLDVPYHADGESCTSFSPSDIYNIYILEEMNITKNTTYLNQLKLYVNTLTSIDEVNDIVYGQELTGEYLKNLNDIMDHSQKIIEVLNAETAKITQ